MTRIASSLSLLTVVVLGMAGCSGTPPRKEDPATTNLRRIYQAFRICDDFKQRFPKDENELKHYLGELGEKGKPEEFLISVRDKKPFVVHYDVLANAPDAIVAHEEDGLNGKRFVLTMRPTITELSDEEFAARMPKKK